MAVVLSGLNIFAKTFSATIRLHRCLRATTINSCRCFVASRDDDRRKRPISSFLKYLSAVRPQLIQENPGVKIAELSKLAALKYNALSDTEKQGLQLDYKKRKAEYDDYLAGLSKSEKEAIKEQKAEKRKRMEKFRLRKEKRKMCMPKRPGGPYSIFLQENWHNESTKPTNIREYNKEVSARWKKLSNTEKEVYQEMFKEEREKYEKDMRVWEAEMVKENKLHLVRKMYLPKPYKPEPKKKRVVSKKSRKVTKAGGGQKKTPQKKTKSKKAAQKKSKSKEKENVAVLGEHELSDLDKD